ncbi:hypothetical protein DFP72DRAFT_1050403 [Ephemerocybe angulata]|uniref:Uncharacterized protein n=1 Tax=Ephemerocybe angulata TaxID=980116 RepID=A0A8H6LZS7_9AGAR|nr:hypothetical protein DFP72DRAFT_1050403 [Tulosesus angulatus]
MAQLTWIVFLSILLGSLPSLILLTPGSRALGSARYQPKINGYNSLSSSDTSIIHIQSESPSCLFGVITMNENHPSNFEAGWRTNAEVRIAEDIRAERRRGCSMAAGGRVPMVAWPKVRMAGVTAPLSPTGLVEFYKPQLKPFVVVPLRGSKVTRYNSIEDSEDEFDLSRTAHSADSAHIMISLHKIGLDGGLACVSRTREWFALYPWTTASQMIMSS